MLKIIFRLLTLSLLTAALLATPARALAEEKKSDAPAAAETAKPVRGLPFTGKLGAVDKTAKTITIPGKEKSRTFQITSETRMRKADKPAILDDAVVGEDVGGTYRKTDDGKLEALTLRFGPKPERATTSRRKKSAETEK